MTRGFLIDMDGVIYRGSELIAGAHYFEDSEAHRDAVADLMATWIAART